MKPWTWWCLLGVAVVSSLAVVGVPVLVIQPFRNQSEADLALGYGLRQAAPMVTLGTLVMAALASWQLARVSRGWRRGLSLVGLGLTAGAGWFARQNHFEWMFAPLPDASYVRAISGGSTFTTTFRRRSTSSARNTRDMPPPPSSFSMR